MSARSERQCIDGVLLLDKPTGMSSNYALQVVKRLYNAKKAGHTGSLDPLATGMLPICFGEATKFSKFLLDANKSYQTTAKMGVITDSGDAEGKIVEQREIGDITEEKLELILERFRGNILQVPSMFSALKKDGKPLYELARQGIEIPRKARPVTIYDLILTALKKDEFSLSAKVSKGTYIRSLVEDIGLALGCGAHVIALRRTAVAHFSQEKMISLEIIKALADEKNEARLQALLHPVDALLQEMPVLKLSENDTASIQKGQRIRVYNMTSVSAGEEVRLYDQGDLFLGVGVFAENDWVKPQRLMASSIDQSRLHKLE